NIGSDCSMAEDDEEIQAEEFASKQESGDPHPVVANGTPNDLERAQRLARKLFHLDGFKRSNVACHLGKNNEFSRMVSEEYLKFFDFTGMPLDQALRSFLMAFVLIGETQERERVLSQFSDRFHHCNPDSFSSSDAVHTLTCAIMLLNTDLHGQHQQNLGKSMSSQDFITNLEGMNNESDFPKEMLKGLYNSIKNEKLEWAVDEEELRDTLMPKSEERSDLGNTLSVRSNRNPFLEVPHDHKAATYKQGFLTRKVHADIDGKKTLKRHKRSWLHCGIAKHCTIRGTIAFLGGSMKPQCDEYKPNHQSSEDAISLHHALAEKANRYNKRPNVFQLKTADWRVFLFLTENTEQMNSWITWINLVAAMFSSPPFPAAVGSQRRFVRPILPASQSKNKEEEQLQSHKVWLETFSDDLTDHQLCPPDKKVKARDVEDYKLKEEYLEYEKNRYEMYVKLLMAKKAAGTDDLDKLESVLLASGKEDGPLLKKSHSSPSLNLEQAPVVVKVKRNVSERRTYRRIIPKRQKNLI
uniref:SEC7 domain-containing protein n=1 Tax=Latimeria chalumnae TaxID=7897 RepID=H3ACU0_LATCH